MGYDPSARRKLGSAPLEVTQLGLGCAPLGGFRAAIAEDEAQAILHTAYDAGVRLFRAGWRAICWPNASARDQLPFFMTGRSMAKSSRRRPRRG